MVVDVCFGYCARLAVGIYNLFDHRAVQPRRFHLDGKGLKPRDHIREVILLVCTLRWAYYHSCGSLIDGCLQEAYSYSDAHSENWEQDNYPQPPPGRPCRVCYGNKRSVLSGRRVLNSVIHSSSSLVSAQGLNTQSC